MIVKEGDLEYKAFQRIVAEVNPPVIPPGKTRSVEVTIPGVEVGDAAMAIPPPHLGHGIVFVGSRVTAENTVTIGLSNHDKKAVQPDTDKWFFIIIPK